MKFFSKVSNLSLIFMIVMISMVEIFLFVTIKMNFFNISLGGGNDADYYNEYALGYLEFGVNSWTYILRYMNEIGLYSRSIISYFFLFLTLIVIPNITTRLAGLEFKGSQKYYLYLFLICVSYPTLFFYTFDIYRDVFMVLSFLIGCLTVKKSLINKNSIQFFLFFLISISIGFFLVGLRPYLGTAFLLSLLLWKIKFTKKRIIFLFMLYLVTLFTANYMGHLDRLTDYRAGFEEGYGGSTLGLDFSNPVMFIPNFILSALGQLFGLYITNPLAIILLLVETFPFVFMLKYVIKNIRLADNFVRFLLIFFVIYGSVWLIGNDNLGTAVRLRMYNYFAIYISFFYILNLKRQQGVK